MKEQLGLDFDVTRSRHRGNEQSTDAYHKNQSSKEKQLLSILEHIKSCGSYGATSDEIVAAMQIPLQTVSARCSELKAKGHVIKSGTRKTTRGCAAAVLIEAAR